MFYATPLSILSRSPGIFSSNQWKMIIINSFIEPLCNSRWHAVTCTRIRSGFLVRSGRIQRSYWKYTGFVRRNRSHRWRLIAPTFKGKLILLCKWKQPTDSTGKQEGPVFACKLKKSIYGLLQAGITWGFLFVAKILNQDFKRSKLDVRVF